MTPAYFRAYTFSDTLTPCFDEYFLLYSTKCYDFCTHSRHIAQEVVGKTPKAIRKLCKSYGSPIKRIDKVYSRLVRTTPKEAIKHLIERKSYRLRCLQKDITATVGFLNKSQLQSVDDMLNDSNKLFSTTYW